MYHISSAGPVTWYIPSRFDGIANESCQFQHQAKIRQGNKGVLFWRFYSGLLSGFVSWARRSVSYLSGWSMSLGSSPSATFTPGAISQASSSMYTFALPE
ncbi:unnamed protein product [Protopolystoma xenopodis]|uniref:Uncharacterized protein n=1 Tax=Protopolystoma xenopodis TaxID=117903 RepID=A0A448WFE3_9PLAT|nr:unnamed protein product [Protopolystoma xenopodis]